VVHASNFNVTSDIVGKLGRDPGHSQSYPPDLTELDGTNGLMLTSHPNPSFPEKGTIEFWVVPDWTSDPGYDPVVVSSVGGQGTNYGSF